MKSTRLSPKEAATAVARTLRHHGYVALFAGGCVRDLLLGGEPKDFDVATDARPEQVASIFRGAQQVGAAFGVVVVRKGGRQVEVATFREDGRYIDGRHPESVRFGSLESDARRRDFTINGMFMDPFDGTIRDDVGGQADLKARLIRAIDDPMRRFEEDRLRMLRAVRFAARLEFDIEPATLAAIRHYAPQLPHISTERVRMELEWIMGHPNRARGWALLEKCGLINVLIPAFEWSPEQLHGVTRRLEALPGQCHWPTPLVVLFHAVETRTAGEACRRLTCSNDTTRDVVWLCDTTRNLVRNEPGELADLRFLRADRRTPSALQLLRAELLANAMPIQRHERWTAQLAKIDPATALPPPFLVGDDLLALGVPQGPIYGQILDAAYRSQLNEQIHDKSEALHFARQWLLRHRPPSESK